MIDNKFQTYFIHFLLFTLSAAVLFDEKHSFDAFVALQFQTLLEPILFDNINTDANILSVLFNLVTGNSLPR